jgi:hypothetical protein
LGNDQSLTIIFDLDLLDLKACHSVAICVRLLAKLAGIIPNLREKSTKIDTRCWILDTEDHFIAVVFGSRWVPDKDIPESSLRYKRTQQQIFPLLIICCAFD